MTASANGTAPLSGDNGREADFPHTLRSGRSFGELWSPSDAIRRGAITMRIRLCVAAVMLVTPMLALAQVPPPPSLPGQDDLGARLVAAIEAKDVKAYAALLSDNLQVFDDGNLIATNKAKWLDDFGKKLAAEGVSFKLSSGYSSTGRLLFTEYFNSIASWGGAVPSHCCWSYDAVAYDIKDGKIAVIRRLRGGDKKLDVVR